MTPASVKAKSGSSASKTLMRNLLFVIGFSRWQERDGLLLEELSRGFDRPLDVVKRNFAAQDFADADLRALLLGEGVDVFPLRVFDVDPSAVSGCTL